MSLYRFKNKL